MSERVERLNAALEGRYRIQGEVGEGGMASVYLAEDLKHRRQVAVKVLKPELAAVVGAERFLAEIETTANLQHPHILPLFDSGEADSFLFYVMPYVEGESLQDRVRREQQLPVDEALRITKGVAGALDYAHRQGVVHRDIKPANILLHEGEPLVADFGIALAVSQAGDGRITETGLSLGTPHYMSPEQAAGERTLDPRSDVYALGCVLYEMLTGQPPFGGPNAQAVLGRILTGDPEPATVHRRAVPPHVDAALMKALERLPADRFESARALADALEDTSFTVTTGTVTRGAGAAQQRWRRRFMGMSAAAAVLLVAAVVGWWPGGGALEESVVRFSQPLPFPLLGLQMAMSPDGTRAVLLDGENGEAYLRTLTTPELEPLGDWNGTEPAFSPGGDAVATVSYSGDLEVRPLSGGVQRTVARDPMVGVPVVWAHDGYIYFTSEEGFDLVRVPAAGGTPETVIPADTQRVYLAAGVLPGGRKLLVTTIDQESNVAEAAIMDLETNELELIGQVGNARSLTYDATTGVLLLANEEFLFGQRLDGDFRPVGEAVPVAEVPEGGMAFAYGGGTLVYAASGTGAGSVPSLVDRSGRTRALPNLPEGIYDFPEASPQGDRIAFQLSRAQGEQDVWIYEMPDGPLSRLSLEGEAQSTYWSNDGEDIFFIRSGDVYRARSDGSQAPELVLDRERNLSRVTVTPDGERIFFQEGPGEWDIGVATLGVEGSDSLLLAADYWEGHPVLSPDGRWLAHYSYASGRAEVYVRPLFGPGRRHQVSREGASRPRWSDDGTELFFATNSGTPELRVATLEVGDDIDVVGIESLVSMASTNYDVMPGDSLFVILTAGDPEAERTNVVTVVHNFDRILRELEGRRP